MTQEGGTPPGFWERVEQIAERAVAKAMRSGPTRNSSIGEGGTFIIRGGRLRVLYPAGEGGGDGVYFGDLYSADAYVGTGLTVQQPNGVNIAEFRSNAATNIATAVIRDNGERTVLYTDNSQGKGLGRPYLPAGHFMRARYGDWTISTVDPNFETLWRTEVYNQHPRLSVATVSSMDTAATTGEVRVMVNGVQLGSTASIGFAQTTTLFGPAVVPDAHFTLLDVQIQGRRTSASGALRVEALHAIGRA